MVRDNAWGSPFYRIRTVHVISYYTRIRTVHEVSYLYVINATVTVVYILIIFMRLFVMDHYWKDLLATRGLEPASPVSVNRHTMLSTIIHPQKRVHQETEWRFMTNNVINISIILFIGYRQCLRFHIYRIRTVHEASFLLNTDSAYIVSYL